MLEKYRFRRLYTRGLSQKYPTSLHFSTLPLFIVIRQSLRSNFRFTCYRIPVLEVSFPSAHWWGRVLCVSSRPCVVESTASERNFRNSQKSQGATQGPGCRSRVISCFVKNCRTRFDERRTIVLKKPKNIFSAPPSRDFFRTLT